MRRKKTRFSDKPGFFYSLWNLFSIVKFTKQKNDSSLRDELTCCRNFPGDIVISANTIPVRQIFLNVLTCDKIPQTIR